MGSKTSFQLKSFVRSWLIGAIVLVMVFSQPISALGQAPEETATEPSTAINAAAATDQSTMTTATEVPTAAPTEVATESPTVVATETATESPIATATPTESPTEAPATATQTEAAEPSETEEATESPAATATETPTEPAKPNKDSKSSPTMQLAVAVSEPTCTLVSPSIVVTTNQYLTYQCISDKNPIKITVTNMTAGWQWSHNFSTNIVPTDWRTTDFGPTEASGNIDTVFIYIRPTATAQPGSLATVTVTIDRPSGKNPVPFTLQAVRGVTTTDFQITCTPNPVIVATSATGTVDCSLSGINVASSANITVNSVTIASVPGWTITRSPASGSLTGATPFAFTLSLTPVCGAAVNPPAPNVTITSQLTFMSIGLTGPSTSITAKHGATSNVSASISGSSLNWSRNYSFAPQSVTGSMTYQVSASGCAGWNIQVSASAFSYTGTASGSPIASSSIAVTPGAPAAVAGSTANVSPGAAGTLGTPIKVLSATENYGVGTYNQTLALGVTIPGGARVGTYTSTVTIAAASGP